MSAILAVLYAAVALVVGMLVVETAQTIQLPFGLDASCAVKLAWLVVVTFCSSLSGRWLLCSLFFQNQL